VTPSFDIPTQRDIRRGGALLQGPPDVSITFPGIPAAVSTVRSVITDSLAGSPRVDEVVLVGCEYATNAIRHSPSGLPGGVFTMRMWIKAGWARLEIIDSGTGAWMDAPAIPAESGPDDEDGRGLIVVAALADACGHSGCCAWAEMSWPGPAKPFWLASVEREQI
jgi:anti-sigma regulatory factor (Ser/Thr protein kinase)